MNKRIWWVVIGIPVIALMFGVAAAVLAFHGADTEVPHADVLPLR